MQISTRTPLRVSFFGGGTDYPAYFKRKPGSVIGMAINKYVYVSALQLSEVIDYRYRVSYSRLEKVLKLDEIQHPVVRAVLKYFNINCPLDISIQSDLPASSGLGSSSAFTVGFLKLISEMFSKEFSKFDLSSNAVHVEQELLKENVGVQDQFHTAYGGINRFDFHEDRISIKPVQINLNCLQYFLSSLVLVHTGIKRYASEIVADQVKATRDIKLDEELSQLVTLVTECEKIFRIEDPELMLKDFGALLHYGWQIKRKLSSNISSAKIDELYAATIAAGAIGGKLCGAGGGGFLLMVVPPPLREKFNESMKKECLIPIGMDSDGAVIL